MSELKPYDPKIRSARAKEIVPPTHGDWGGPLCCIVAKYEDGTEISFGHEGIEKIRNTRPSDAPTELVIPVKLEGGMLYPEWKRSPGLARSICAEGNVITKLIEPHQPDAPTVPGELITILSAEGYTDIEDIKELYNPTYYDPIIAECLRRWIETKEDCPDGRRVKVQAHIRIIGE